jgi:hypothetical protein
MYTVKDKIEYTIALVKEFGKKRNLSEVESFNYLDRFKGIDFIDRHYGIAHTLSFEEMVDNIGAFCRKSGGKL